MSFDDLFEHWIPLGCKEYNLKLFNFTIVAWALWLTRNKTRIQNIFPRSPASIIYKIHSLLQKWEILLRRPDGGKTEGLREQVISWLKNFEESRSQPDEDIWISQCPQAAPCPFLLSRMWLFQFVCYCSVGKLATPTNLFVTNLLLLSIKAGDLSSKKILTILMCSLCTNPYPTCVCNRKSKR